MMVLLVIYLLRMSEKEEQDFMTEYLTWMEGPGLDLKSLTVYNFGYNRYLPFSSISLSPKSKSSGAENPRITKVKNIIETNSIQGYESILNNLRCCTLFFRHYQNQKGLFLILLPYLVALLLDL